MASSITFKALDEPRLVRLAELLALRLQPGQCVTLTGDLGAGKSTFARAFIRARLADRFADVPSPTFPLLQTYETARGPIWHFDWYRLSAADDLDDLDLETGLETAVVLIEWPAIGMHLLGSHRIDIAIEEVAGAPDQRAVTATARDNATAALLSRVAALDNVLSQFAAENSAERLEVDFLQGDASARAYARVRAFDTAGDVSVRLVLMDSPAMPDGPPVRGGKSYSSIAKLAEDVGSFVAIARHLRGAGFSAPEIVSADLDRGVLLIEDFGSDGFWTAMPDTAQQACDLTNAIDTLAALRCANLSTRMAAAGETGTYELPAFDETARHIEAELLLDWAWPSLTQSPLASATRENYVAAWMAAFANIDTAADEPGWVLRDVHSPNLIRLPDRVSPANVGLLDFQDALAGAWAYDVASLLQDARKDVPPDLESEMKERYIARFSEQTAVPFDRKQFEAAYAFWGAQRAAKIIGIFHRLDARDGKPAYLAHLPRLTHALSRNLDHPALAPVAAWFARHLPEIHRNDRS